MYFMPMSLHLSGNVFSITTPGNSYDYTKNLIAPRETYFEFDVIACSDVHLALAENVMNVADKSYEIVIGGWDNTR